MHHVCTFHELLRKYSQGMAIAWHIAGACMTIAWQTAGAGMAIAWQMAGVDMAIIAMLASAICHAIAMHAPAVCHAIARPWLYCTGCTVLYCSIVTIVL